jgi:hypothetical protein
MWITLTGRPPDRELDFEAALLNLAGPAPACILPTGGSSAAEASVWSVDVHVHV